MKRFGWIAALLVLVVVNGMVLAGVAWNRSGAPDATLRLTERELALPNRYYRSQENSGVALRIKLHEDSYSPDWLDRDKLRELGFSVPDTGIEPNAADDRYKRPLPRRAWVALEFDGTAWQAALAARQRQLTETRLKLDTGEATREQIRNLEKNLARMRRSGSRLIAVDAGTDPAVLRARYPDTTRYLIAGVRVRLSPGSSQSPEKGYLRLLVNRVHVPLRHRRVLTAVVGDELRDNRAPDADQAPRYAVQLQVGRRYEAWVEQVVALE